MITRCYNRHNAPRYSTHWPSFVHIVDIAAWICRRMVSTTRRCVDRDFESSVGIFYCVFSCILYFEGWRRGTTSARGYTPKAEDEGHLIRVACKAIKRDGEPNSVSPDIFTHCCTRTRRPLWCIYGVANSFDAVLPVSKQRAFCPISKNMHHRDPRASDAYFSCDILCTILHREPDDTVKISFERLIFTWWYLDSHWYLQNCIIHVHKAVTEIQILGIKGTSNLHLHCAGNSVQMQVDSTLCT